MNIYILFPLDTAHMKLSFLTLKACVPTRVNSLCLLSNSFHKIRNRSQQEEEGEAAFGWVQLFCVGRYVGKGLQRDLSYADLSLLRLLIYMYI